MGNSKGLKTPCQAWSLDYRLRVSTAPRPEWQFSSMDHLSRVWKSIGVLLRPRWVARYVFRPRGLRRVGRDEAPGSGGGLVVLLLQGPVVLDQFIVRRGGPRVVAELRAPPSYPVILLVPDFVSCLLCVQPSSQLERRAATSHAVSGPQDHGQDRHGNQQTPYRESHAGQSHGSITDGGTSTLAHSRIERMRELPACPMWQVSILDDPLHHGFDVSC
jgi:hypothetical protein